MPCSKGFSFQTALVSELFVHGPVDGLPCSRSLSSGYTPNLLSCVAQIR